MQHLQMKFPGLQFPQGSQQNNMPLEIDSINVSGSISSTTIVVTGSTQLKVTTATTSATLDTTYYYVNADATSGAIVLTLPTAIGISGTVYIVKKTDSSANTVTITPFGAQTIDGVANEVISAQYDSISIISDGANWYQQVKTTVSAVDGGSA